MTIIAEAQKVLSQPFDRNRVEGCLYAVSRQADIDKPTRRELTKALKTLLRQNGILSIPFSINSKRLDEKR